ncbi:MAG: protein translocase subunit SecF [Clostridia bacterium]|nr:protein translocase subunit SecF [Clostridia bacterium]
MIKKLFKGEFAYMQNLRFFYYFTAVVFAICIICNIIFGTSLDIAFKGGTLVRYSFEGDLTEKAVSDYVSQFKYKSLDVQISEAVSPGSGEKYQLINIYTTNVLDTKKVTKLNEAMEKQFKDYKVKQDSTSSIQATIGKLFFIKCLVTVALATIFLLIYVGFRFRRIGGWPAAVMAIFALIHDLFIAYFSFIIFGISLNDNFVAVILTILGYSINGTIVVYDRVRSNRRLMPKASLNEVADVALNQTFTRNFNTFLTTFIAIGTVAIVALLSGLESITSFAVPMMIGTVAGFYSSTFLCIPTWVLWMNKRAEKAKAKEKAKKK